MNKVWHADHPMPKNPTRAQRAQWHLEHSQNCGCRPVPAGIVADVAALKSP
jgi:hypothetical protein